MKKILIFLLVFLIALPCFATPFEDMEKYLVKAKEDGVLFGDEKGVLHEDDDATRAEFLAIATRFWKLSGGKNSFSDVKEGDWFCGSIAAANFCGIFYGTPEGEAKPFELIKTEDAVSIIGRYYGATEHKGSYKGLSKYAEAYFGYAFENGLFSGWKQLPNPKHSITKGEIVSLFYRYQEKNQQSECFEKGYPKLSAEQQFGAIFIDIKTTVDCSISYALSKKNESGYSWTAVPETLKAGEVKKLRITADINKMYDVYIKAVLADGGQSRITGITDVMPLSFTKGEGSLAQPYVVYTEKQLRQISALPDRAYILGNDITVSEGFTPIKEFRGSLNGNGYRIDGIKISDNSQRAGLFESVEGGTVKNLTVDADIAVKDIAGVIAGENSGTIEGCCVTGYVDVGGGNGGGICGINRGKIEDCLSCVYSVKAGSFAGGIAGQNFDEIKNCLSAAETVTSDMYSGGISGTNSGGRISGCVAVNVAVYNTMTYNGGKISTNKSGGVTENNYSLAEMVSNAAKTEMSADSRNGLELSWDEFKDMSFYRDIGWDVQKWKNAKGGFVLICPKNAAEPLMESGRTAYFPKKISSADELIAIRKNGAGHYVLTRDITLNVPWKTIDLKDGFSGSLDGRGYTVYNLNLKGETGIFSNIVGGTVKNLNLKQVNATPSANGGIISACNYGYIENCTVSGTIETSKTEKVGAITGENNGQIENCTAEVKIIADGISALAGGICAENCGVISRCAFSGSISSDSESSVIGGICAKDTEGYISESAAKLSLVTTAGQAVAGGICALSEDTQIYKCAAMGKIRQSGNEIAAGGICAEVYGSTVYDCFSQTEISLNAGRMTAGGICAKAVGSNIQNTYATGRLSASGANAVAGGICAIADGSVIVQNVALCPSISANKTANAIVGDGVSSDINDNYSCRSIRKNGKSAQYGDKNGKEMREDELLNVRFYLKPLSENGALGWENTVWTERSGYALPVLTDTPLMENVKNPTYE